MTNLELAYLAGIMDADGFFSIKRQTYSIRVKKEAVNPTYCERVGIKQVTPQAIQMIHDNFGGYYRIEKPSAKNGKPLHAVELRNRKAAHFISAILPYLRIKKLQAEILVLLRKSLSQGRTKIINKDEPIRYSLSEKQVEYRESLMAKIKELNDTRDHPAFTPKPWR